MTRISFYAAIAALLLPCAALGFNSYLLRDLPVSHMTDEDRELLKARVDDFLERGRDGESMRWENPKTGAHGDLALRASFDRDGQRCRDLEVANSARGHDNRLVVTLCKQPGGEWKVDSR